MGWGANVATTYADTQKAVYTAPNQFLDLRVLGVGEFMSALAACVARTQSGEATAQQVLDAVAAQWTAIVDRNGKVRAQAAFAKVVAQEEK